MDEEKRREKLFEPIDFSKSEQVGRRRALENIDRMIKARNLATRSTSKTYRSEARKQLKQLKNKQARLLGLLEPPVSKTPKAQRRSKLLRAGTEVSLPATRWGKAWAQQNFPDTWRTKTYEGVLLRESGPRKWTVRFSDGSDEELPSSVLREYIL